MSQYYSYKDVVVNLRTYDGFSGTSGYSGITDTSELTVSNLDITYQATTSAKYLIQERHSFDYVADNGIGGNIGLTYYMTGNDPFRTITNLDKDRTIDIEMNGLFFNSGYLENYSFRGRPNQPVIVDANVVFFGPPTGNFAAPASPNTNTGHLLNFSDATISTDNSSEEIDGIQSFDYSYSAQIEPSYVQETGINGQILSNLLVHHVVFGPKITQVNIVRENLHSGLALTGHMARIVMNLNHPYIPATDLTESFDISGSLFSKTYAVGVDGHLQSQISIKQNHLGEFPEITNIAYFSS
jgi:hypothetical protein